VSCRFQSARQQRSSRRRSRHDLAKSRPLAYGGALDLLPESVGFTSVQREWNAAGLAPDRGLLVARNGLRAVAVTTMELAADATHVYRLLDLVRLYALEPDGNEAFPALLDAARSFDVQHGKPAFVLFQEHDMELPDDVVAQAYDMGYADTSILSATLAPELLEYVFQITSPRIAQRFSVIQAQRRDKSRTGSAIPRPTNRNSG
jgi:hypothetical protein